MDLLRYNLRTVRSYLLKEDFQFFWGYRSLYWAGCFDGWCTRTMRSKIGPMKRVARMLRGHRLLILNWFLAKGQLSSGVVEGCNAKAKLTTRKAYGFRTYHGLEVALYHTLGALPEPKFTYREEALIISSMGRDATQGSPMVFPVRLLSCTGNTG